MKEFLKTFYEILAGKRRRAAFCAALIALAGLCEGLALLTLIPILEHNLGRPDDGKAGVVDRISQFLGVDGQELFLLGLGAFVVLGVATAGLTFLSENSRLRLRARMEEDYRKRMSDALISMEWAHFISMKIGDISKSLVMEGFQIATGAYMFVLAVGTAFVALLFFCSAMIVSMKMTLYTMLFGVAGIGVYRCIARRGNKHSDRLSDLLSNIGEQIDTIFDSLKFFRATGRSGLARSEAFRIFHIYSTSFHLSQMYGEFIRFVLESGAVLFIAAFLLLMLMVQQESAAVALVFLAIFYRLTPRLITVQKNIYQARTTLPYYWTWKERLNAALAHPMQHFGDTRPSLDNALELERVSFTYPTANEPALSDISLRLAKGRCMAVVGPSGSGKSSLIDLVLGLLPPNAGEIRLDDVPLNALDIEAWRNRIGLVLQESPIFHATVLENIAWGAPEPDRERARHVADMANCLDFINDLPQGLDTVVGEKGGRLSGGQRQRLALARALYRHPWLLILDEATSALDSSAEAEVQRALETVKGSCAILMVAHRLKTVQMADTIVVLDKGRVTEMGSWDELANKENGVFRSMARMQGVQL